VVWAGRGLGCFLDGTPCRVSDHDTVAGAYVTASALGNWPTGALDATHAAGAQVRTWGDAYGYALVATGRVEAMVDHQAAVWDVAPMLTIIPEAGGRFSDLSGEVTATGGSGLATNGHLHDDVLALVLPPPD
jgi:fructose-1,6-bisphosphatase/inositol monophosphatase family enzyme